MVVSTSRLAITRPIIIGLWAIIFFYASLFLSCKHDPVQKESWAVVVNFISPDTAYYPGIKNFPFPDSLKFGSLDRFFTNGNKAPIINDSSIVFFDNYQENGKKICCKKDTLDIYIDSIKGKKYLFAIGDYITVFQSNSNADSNIRKRESTIAIPLWGIRLNTPYPADKFNDEYEKLGSKYVKLREELNESYRQAWSENDSILVETIQFKNSTDRIITAIQKDMNEHEVDSTIVYLRNKFPNLEYKEGSQAGGDQKPVRLIKIDLQGVSILFTQVSATGYSFAMTDYYETIRLIMKNAETGYIFRDDLSIY